MKRRGSLLIWLSLMGLPFLVQSCKSNHYHAYITADKINIQKGNELLTLHDFEVDLLPNERVSIYTDAYAPVGYLAKVAAICATKRIESFELIIDNQAYKLLSSAPSLPSPATTKTDDGSIELSLKRRIIPNNGKLHVVLPVGIVGANAYSQGTKIKVGEFDQFLNKYIRDSGGIPHVSFLCIERERLVAFKEALLDAHKKGCTRISFAILMDDFKDNPDALLGTLFNYRPLPEF